MKKLLALLLVPVIAFCQTREFLDSQGQKTGVAASGTILTVYAAGTAYAMTNSAAKLDFGTTDPVLVISSAGTWKIQGRVVLKYNAATFVGVQTATVKFRRTNNTAADLTSGSTTQSFRILTAITDSAGAIALPTVYYTTANANDSIEIFGVLSAAPGAGTVDAIEAEITAERIY